MPHLVIDRLAFEVSAHCGGMTTTSEVLTSHQIIMILSCGWRQLRIWSLYRHLPAAHRIGSAAVLRLVCRAEPRPLTVQRAQIERYVRWMQEVRRFKPSMVSRRMAVVTGFYRTCVIDAVLERSPDDYVRRPLLPAESPTFGLSHLQFEVSLTAARESANVFDFALVTMLGLLGLRIFETCGADIARPAHRGRQDRRR